MNRSGTIFISVCWCGIGWHCRAAVEQASDGDWLAVVGWLLGAAWMMFFMWMVFYRPHWLFRQRPTIIS